MRESCGMCLPPAVLPSEEFMNSVNKTEIFTCPAINAYHYAMPVASAGFRRPGPSRSARVAAQGRTSHTFIRVEDR